MADRQLSKRHGPAVAFEFPCFKNENWIAFEKIIGTNLSSKARTDIEQAANQCVVEHFFIEQDGQRIRQKGRVTKTKKPGKKDQVKDQTPPLMLLRAMRELFERWADIQGISSNKAPPGGAKRAIDIYSDETSGTMRNDLDRLMGELKVHEVALSNFLDRPKGRPPFIGFVGRLAEVFEKVTGKQPTKTIPKDQGDPEVKQSPFVNFVLAVDACLPTTAQRSGVDTAGATPQAVRRALQKYKPTGNSPSKT
jgi:hypothetical protein